MLTPKGRRWGPSRQTRIQVTGGRLKNEARTLTRAERERQAALRLAVWKRRNRDR